MINQWKQVNSKSYSSNPNATRQTTWANYNNTIIVTLVEFPESNHATVIKRKVSNGKWKNVLKKEFDTSGGWEKSRAPLKYAYSLLGKGFQITY